MTIGVALVTRLAVCTAATLAATMAATMAATTAVAQDAAQVLATVREKQNARWSSVRNYTLIQTTQGREVPSYLEKFLVDGQPAFRVVPQTEWERSRTELTAGETKAIASNMAIGLEIIGDVHQKEVGGPLGAYIKSMTSDMAVFARAAAAAEEDSGTANAAQGVRMAAEFARRARLAGREALGGRGAFVIRADDLGDVALGMPNGAPEFTLESITMWVDAEHYVTLRVAMQGRMGKGGAPVTIEVHDQAYRQFGPLYEPTRRVMRITGMMDAMATDPKKKQDAEKMRRDAERARAQLAELDKRLAQMPPAQRRMVEGQMQKMRKQLEMMTDDGVMEVEVALDVIGINAGPPLDWRPGAGPKD